jgi:hypothetical protein
MSNPVLYHPDLGEHVVMIDREPAHSFTLLRTICGAKVEETYISGDEDSAQFDNAVRRWGRLPGLNERSRAKIRQAINSISWNQQIVTNTGLGMLETKVRNQAVSLASQKKELDKLDKLVSDLWIKNQSNPQVPPDHRADCSHVEWEHGRGAASPEGLRSRHSGTSHVRIHVR